MDGLRLPRRRDKIRVTQNAQVLMKSESTETTLSQSVAAWRTNHTSTDALTTIGSSGVK
jgi:hypothetical protein